MESYYLKHPSLELVADTNDELVRDSLIDILGYSIISFYEFQSLVLKGWEVL